MKKVFGMILLFSFLFTISNSANACPKGWYKGPNGTCKKF